MPRGFRRRAQASPRRHSAASRTYGLLDPQTGGCQRSGLPMLFRRELQQTPPVGTAAAAHHPRHWDQQRRRKQDHPPNTNSGLDRMTSSEGVIKKSWLRPKAEPQAAPTESVDVAPRAPSKCSKFLALRIATGAGHRSRSSMAGFGEVLLSCIFLVISPRIGSRRAR